MKIVTESPCPVNDLRASVPPNVAAATAKSLQKLPADRFSSAGKFAAALKDRSFALSMGSDGSNAERLVAYRRLFVGSLLLAVIASVVALLGWLRTVEVPTIVAATYSVPLQLSVDNARGALVAVSPDARSIAFTNDTENGGGLYIRHAHETKPTMIDGTDGGYTPFFSPDGQWIGFTSAGQLRRVPLSGGTAITITAHSNGGELGATWLDDGAIVFSSFNAPGLVRVTAEGAIDTLTHPDANIGDLQHIWPHSLPDSKHILFTIIGEGQPRIAILSLETGHIRNLFDGLGPTRYLDTGHIVYSDAGNLWSVPFSLGAKAITGAPVRVLENVYADVSSHTFGFDVTTTGVLAYVPSDSVIAERIVSISASGTIVSLVEGWGGRVRLSPDGLLLATDVGAPGVGHIWILDLSRNTRTRLTTEGSNLEPVWTPDGKHVTFGSRRGSEANRIQIYWKAVDGSSAAQRLNVGQHPQYPSSWSPDGSMLAFYEVNPETRRDIWILDVNSGSASPVIRTRSNEHTPAFSPDGQWLAYVSDETGTNEVYVRAFPNMDHKLIISTGGGQSPAWSPNGRTLFYRRDRTLIGVEFESGPIPVLGTRKVLVDNSSLKRNGVGAGGRYYDVSEDGDTFVMVQEVRPQGIHEIVVVPDLTQMLSDRGHR